MVSFLIFALVAYATIRGVLAPARSAFASASTVALANQTLPVTVGAVVAPAALAVVAWRRVPIRHLVAGVLIGLLVPRAILRPAC